MEGNQAALTPTTCVAINYDVVNGTFSRYDCDRTSSGDGSSTTNCQWNLYFQINGTVQFNYTAAPYMRTEDVKLVDWTWPIPWRPGVCPPGFCNKCSTCLPHRTRCTNVSRVGTTLERPATQFAAPVARDVDPMQQDNEWNGRDKPVGCCGGGAQ